MDCPDATVFASYFAQRLSSDETQRLFKHVATCVFCASKLRSAATQASVAPVDLGSSPTVFGGATADAAPAPPRLLGRYRVDRVLGVGGMGVVYAAHDPELDRAVAIKLLRPSTRAPVAVLRAQLTREAQAMARLSHPNVINVYEIGTFGEQVFVVMELIDGMTLTDWLQKERGWREIVRVFVAAGQGLAAAHAAGVIHRDFKPDNVLIARNGRICVTDFGLARIDREELEFPEGESGARGEVRLTYSGRLVGTPGYMPPEQMRGEQTDERSDVFSFCVALYEALFGTRPYLGKQLDELRAAMEEGRMQPPLRTGAPLVYRRAIERGLLPLAANRQASMEELLAVLRVDPIERRNRRLLVALAVAAVALAGFGFQRQRHRTQLCRGAESRLVGVWDDARKSAIAVAFARSGAPSADASRRGVERVLDRVAAEWVSMNSEACEATRLRGTQSEQLLDRRMRCLDRRLAELRYTTTLLSSADEKLVANASTTVAAIDDVGRCGDLDALNQEIEPPAGVPKKELESLREGLARVVVLDNAGHLAEEKALLPDLLARAQRMGYLDAEAEARRYAATMLVRDGEFEKAIVGLQEAVAVAERAHDDMVVWEAWRFITLANMQLGRDNEALVWARNTLGIGERVHVNGGQIEVRAIETRLLERAGRVDEALAEARRLLPLIDALADQGYAATYRDQVAGALTEMGHADEALPAFERNLAFALREVGPDHDMTLYFRNNLVACLLSLERFTDALPDAEQIVAATERLHGADNTSTGIALTNLAEAEEGVGRLAQARAHLERAVGIFEKHSIGGELMVEALTHLGQVQLALLDAQSATTLRRAIGIGETGKLSPLLMAPARFALARTLVAQQPVEAVALARRARDAFAQAAASGARQTLAQRDRVAAWLNAHP